MNVRTGHQRKLEGQTATGVSRSPQWGKEMKTTTLVRIRGGIEGCVLRGFVGRHFNGQLKQQQRQQCSKESGRRTKIGWRRRKWIVRKRRQALREHAATIRERWAEASHSSNGCSWRLRVKLMSDLMDSSTTMIYPDRQVCPVSGVVFRSGR